MYSQNQLCAIVYEMYSTAIISWLCTFLSLSVFSVFVAQFVHSLLHVISLLSTTEQCRNKNLTTTITMHMETEEKERNRKQTRKHIFEMKMHKFPALCGMDYKCHIQLVDLPESLNRTMYTKNMRLLLYARKKRQIYRRK